MAIGASGSGAAFEYAANQSGIPEIFSKLLQAKFYASSVLPAISNTDFEAKSLVRATRFTSELCPT